MSEKNRDELREALGCLPVPALPPAVAARVLGHAKAHLEPVAGETSRPWRLTLAGALVPGLLATAALDQLADTVKTVDAVYGPDQRPRSK